LQAGEVFRDKAGTKFVMSGIQNGQATVMLHLGEGVSGVGDEGWFRMPLTFTYAKGKILPVRVRIVEYPSDQED